MSTKRRSWSVEQKLQLIQEANQYGITETLRKHNVAHRYSIVGKESLTMMEYQVCSPSITALILKLNSSSRRMNA